ncbi:MAG: helix-turn-helix domain-containing protein [Candidatus Omnitrophica bacterium]|nr:helix-turn-helix domain-containing protein [Candidatus Omnitrophota bacterium]
MPKLFNVMLGNKLKAVRDKLGMTLEEVAQKMGFNSYQTLSSIEEGRRMVKAVELAKLSKIYFRDMKYFLNEEIEQDQDQPVLWRAYSGDAKVKQREGTFIKFCEHYSDLEFKLAIDSKPKINFLTWQVGDFNYDSIAGLANNLRNELQLGARPACSLAKVLEEKCNIKILFLDLENYGSAASTVGKFGAAILINSSEPSWRRNYDLAHELFHIITWNTFPYDTIHSFAEEKPLVEKWADAFASYLLLPGEEISREFNKNVEDNKISLLDLIGIAREFEVSLDALLWSLVNLRFFSRQIVRKILNDPEVKTLDFSGQKKETTPYLSRRYFNLALKAYKKTLISKGRLCEYLNINRADLGKILKEYGYSVGEEIYETKFALA